jgi:hypothetical protein
MFVFTGYPGTYPSYFPLQDVPHAIIKLDPLTIYP